MASPSKGAKDCFLSYYPVVDGEEWVLLNANWVNALLSTKAAATQDDDKEATRNEVRGTFTCCVVLIVFPSHNQPLSLLSFFASFKLTSPRVSQFLKNNSF